MIFDMMNLLLKRKSRSGRHTLWVPTIRKNARKAFCFLFGRSFYIIWLGNEVFANKVSRKVIGVVCKERHKLAHTQCPCQERWEARSLLLRLSVEQLWPELVRYSLNPRTTHDCDKNRPSNHYKGAPKIRQSGLSSQQQSLSDLPRCRKSSGNWRCDI